MSKARILLITLAVAATLLATTYALFEISKSRTFQFFGDVTSRVETDEKVVALTFDDAPSPYSDEVLNILSAKQVKATFYVIGRELEKYPDEGVRIAEAGHELGNHSYTHERFLLKSISFIDDELQRTNERIRATGYMGTITFRPPYGKKLFTLPWYLSKHGITTVTWDVEPDTFGTDTDFLVQYTLDHVQSGSIILLHPFCVSCQADRDAMPLIINGLKDKGFRFVTVRELLDLQRAQ
jgi:peptidoglycan-N-acetylglucosamine deacetylase